MIEKNCDTKYLQEKKILFPIKKKNVYRHQFVFRCEFVLLKINIFFLFFSDCNHHTKVSSSPNGPHTSCHNSSVNISNDATNHRDSVNSHHSNRSSEKTPPAIPPKQHKHSHLHSNTCSLPNSVHMVINGSVVHGAVDVQYLLLLFLCDCIIFKKKILLYEIKSMSESGVYKVNDSRTEKVLKITS